MAPYSIIKKVVGLSGKRNLIKSTMKIKIFPFNPFQVNTYVVYDETGECMIVDAASYSSSEENMLKKFITDNQLIPVLLVNTHTHIDHILGNNFVSDTWGLKPVIHKDGLPFIENAVNFATTYGFEIAEPVKPEEFVLDGEVLTFGNQEFRILETPGHAAGSICLYNEKENLVIAGDVLFHNSIGRTDLPTGNFDVLAKSIYQKLFTLPDKTIVYCGHGSSTTIGDEKKK
jgi:hydroxyacylglutathione hydrolase